MNRLVNRTVVSLVLSAGLAGSLTCGLDTAVAAEVDAQDILLLKQAVEEQRETITSLRKRVSELEIKTIESQRTVESLRQSNSMLTKDLVTQDQMKALAARLEQVDTNRRRDSEKITETLKKIIETPPAPAPGPVHRPPEKPGPRPRADIDPTSPGGDSEPGATSGHRAPIVVKAPVDLPAESYKYVVKPDETLSEILVAYRKEYGLKTTLAQVRAANPKLNPERLRPGQTVLIPIVK